ncbi:unnamed protein product, partial [Scytosiphon promiscuus]
MMLDKAPQPVVFVLKPRNVSSACCGLSVSRFFVYGPTTGIHTHTIGGYPWPSAWVPHDHTHTAVLEKIISLLGKPGPLQHVALFPARVNVPFSQGCVVLLSLHAGTRDG